MDGVEPIDLVPPVDRAPSAGYNPRHRTKRGPDVDDPRLWKRCSVCKTPIGLGAVYWACNVSTCNRKRTALVFCGVDCWEVHLPDANHRESWAVEKRAPARADDAGDPPRAPRRRVVRPQTSPTSASASSDDEVLIVASRLKDFVKRRAGYNTSDRVLEPLSDIVRRVCERAIDNARREGRKTVLDRDIPDDL